MAMDETVFPLVSSNSSHCHCNEMHWAKSQDNLKYKRNSDNNRKPHVQEWVYFPLS